tara:strand:- start:385 stop:1098 length:714 start_codon:yes stop_codon:yes gene_type:complete
MAASFDPDKFGNAWSKVQDHFTTLYGKLEKSGASREKIIRKLTDIDVERLVMVEFRLNGELEAVMTGYLQELKNMRAFADISEDIIKSLMTTDSLLVKSKLIEAGNTIKSTMIQSVIGGLSEEAFALRLEAIGFQPHQANALVNENLRRFSRSVTNEMANNAPPATLYIWEGPVDERTSAECLDLMSLGPMTQAEFESVFPGAFVNGTHFNCRHQAQRYLSKEQFKGSEVKEQMAHA